MQYPRRGGSRSARVTTDGIQHGALDLRFGERLGPIAPGIVEMGGWVVQANTPFSRDLGLWTLALIVTYRLGGLYWWSLGVK